MAAAITPASGSVKMMSFPKDRLHRPDRQLARHAYLRQARGTSQHHAFFAGILPRAVVAADDDYALATNVPVIRLREDNTYLMTTANASAATHVGKQLRHQRRRDAQPWGDRLQAVHGRSRAFLHLGGSPPEHGRAVALLIHQP